MDKKVKTNHQPGYHKPVVNPTTNYPMDSHKKFCLRCMVHNGGRCPMSGKKVPFYACNV